MEGANNEAGHYIRQYLNAFPNELFNRDEEIYDNFRQEKKMQFVSASTETIQARLWGIGCKRRLCAGRAKDGCGAVRRELAANRGA